MIPKKIHYCWFGNGKKPELALKCIESWKKYLPNYEIIEWNETTFDFSKNKYAKEAYEAKQYAFLTDYVRLYVLNKHGGIYMDTDVEVLKPLDKFLNHSAFTGCESKYMCVTGIMGATKNHNWVNKLLSYYDGRSFLLPDGSYDKTTNTKIITKITIDDFGWVERDSYQILKDDLHIYPFEVFCAKDFTTGELNVTTKTFTIHHFSGSWHSPLDKVKGWILKSVGPKNKKTLLKINNKLKRIMKKSES